MHKKQDKYEIKPGDFKFPKSIINQIDETCSNGFMLIRINGEGDFEVYQRMNSVFNLALIPFLRMTADKMEESINPVAHSQIGEDDDEENFA